MKWYFGLLIIILLATLTLFFVLQPKDERTFVLAGNDLTLMRESLASMEEGLQFYISKQKTEHDKELVKNLYPLNFLHAAIDAEEARRTSAPDYKQKLQIARAAYQSDLKNFRTAFNEAVDSDAKLVSLEGVVSKNSVLNTIDSLLKQKKLQTVSLHDLGVAVATTTPAIPTEVSQILQAAKKRTAPRYVVKLLDSACAASLTEPYFAVRPTQSIPVELIGDLMLYPGGKIQTGLAQYLKTQGADFVPVSISNYYQCPNVGSDYARIFSALSSSTEAQIYQSAGLDQLLYHIAQISIGDTQLEKKGIRQDFSPKFLFLAKSAFTGLFLAFNKSVSEEVPSIAQPDPKYTLFGSAVLWSVLRKTVSREQIVHDIAEFYKAHQE
ncbi:hypothetical protein KW798_02045 [Candidatus Parcubacteria bacterium]|nr:hypothetical protein [Candidatus Parcubacteria bacterium]